MLTAPEYFLQLNNIDYDLQRNKDQILAIFTRSGWINSVTTFNKLWNICETIGDKIYIKSFKKKNI